MTRTRHILTCFPRPPSSPHLAGSYRADTVWTACEAFKEASGWLVGYYVYHELLRGGKMTVCDCVGRRRERRGWSRGRSAPRLSSLSSSDAVVSRCGVGHGPCCAGPKIESGPAFLRALTHPPLGFVAHFHPPCPTVLSLRPRTCTDAGHRERLVIADTNLLPGHPDIRPVAGGSSLPTARGLGLREHVRGVVPLPGPDRSLVLPVCSPHGSYLQRHTSPQTGYVGITSSRLYRPVWITQRYGFRQDSGAVALRPPCKS